MRRNIQVDFLDDCMFAECDMCYTKNDLSYYFEITEYFTHYPEITIDRMCVCRPCYASQKGMLADLIRKVPLP